MFLHENMFETSTLTQDCFPTSGFWLAGNRTALQCRHASSYGMVDFYSLSLPSEQTYKILKQKLKIHYTWNKNFSNGNSWTLLIQNPSLTE